jgi:protein involved in polysaccharide export with SLBB domain
VTISGEVGRPGNVPFREGMSLGDLITEVGRLKPTADLTVEIYRVMKSVDGERQPIPEIHSIRVDSAYLVNRDANRLYAKHIAGFTYLVDRAAAFKLMPYDRVVVKRQGRVNRTSRFRH